MKTFTFHGEPYTFLIPKDFSDGISSNINESNYFFLCLFLRETDKARVGQGQRERETKNPKQDPGSELSAQSPMWDSGTTRS